MPKYVTCGQIIDSILSFPELPETTLSHPSVTLQLGSLSFQPPNTGRVIYRPINPNEVFVYYRPAGVALVRNGSEITLEAAENADPLTVRLFVLQQALGVVLLQRGYFVLHSSAAVVNGRAVAFAGPSGQGKSTMTAALAARGGLVLTDDVLALDPTDPVFPMALPGLLHLKLTEQTRNEVVPDVAAVQNLHEKRGKKLCALRGAAVQEAAQLDSIYLLETGPEIRFERIPPARAAIELVRHTYGSHLLGHIGRAQSHFQQCAALARNVPIIQLCRPRDLRLLGTVADEVVARVRQRIP